MATLVVRKVDDEIARRLKERAKAAGRSAEAEHRLILENVLKPHRTGAEMWQEMRAAGPLLDDEDDFFRILDNLDQPAEQIELPD